MSQGQIAEALGIDNRVSISGYERGEREPPTADAVGLRALAHISTDLLIAKYNYR